MPNKKISALPTVTTLLDTDILPSVASSVTSKITVANLRTKILTGATLAWASITGTPTTLAGYGITDGVSLGPNIFSGLQTFSVGTEYTPMTAPALSAGRVWYDSDKAALAYYNAVMAIHPGEELVLAVRNASGATIAAGKVVYVSGAIGNKPTISLATNADDTANKTIGLTVASVLNNGDTYIVTHGVAHNLDTSALTEGGILWLDTAGGVTTTRPSDPTRQVRLGYCVRQHATQGELLISVQVLDILTDLSDVSITTPATGQYLTYDGAKWVNTTIDTDLSALASLGTTGIAVRTGTGTWTTRTLTGTTGQITVTNGSGTGGNPTISLPATITQATTFQVANGVTSRAAATQDGIILAGRAGGTTSLAVTLTPAVLTSSRVQTLLDASGTVALYEYAGTWTAAQTIDRGTGALPALPNPTHTTLALYNADAVPVRLTTRSYGASGLTLEPLIAEGTRASPAAVIDSRILWQTVPGGYDGTTWQNTAAWLRITADGLWSGSNRGTYLAFDGTPNGSTTRAEWMRLQNGNLGLGVTPTAGNGLLQIASGTSKANGFAMGADIFGHRAGSSHFRFDLGGSPILEIYTTSNTVPVLRFTQNGVSDRCSIGANGTVMEFRHNGGTLNMSMSETTWGVFGNRISKPTVAAAATDAATTQTLANSIRTILINYGLAS